MRRSIARIASWAGIGLVVLWAVFSIIVTLLGIGTIPEDVQRTMGLAERFLHWLFQTPWWVPTLLALLLAVVVILLSGWGNERGHTSLPDSINNLDSDDWADSERVEIYVLANVAAGREPFSLKLHGGTALARLRELKTAIDSQEMPALLRSERANIHTAVSLSDFGIWASDKSHWFDVVKTWSDHHASPSTLHDVWLLDAVHYVAGMEWGEHFDLLDAIQTDEGGSSGSAHIIEATKHVIQWASDGSLVVWGRTGLYGPITPIENEYWRYYGFEFLSMYYEDPESLTTQHERGPQSSVMCCLKVTKSEVEALCQSIDRLTLEKR